jgi:4-amino-4-deoxy-L-arabinose transferase
MMLKEEHSHKIIALVVFAISVVCITTCGSWGVIETSEARYAEIAREMYRKKEFLNPTLLSIHHYHKPPLTYWITDVGFWLFGANEFGGRFFLQLALLTQTFIVYKLSALLFDKFTALFAAIIYLSFPIVLVS